MNTTNSSIIQANCIASESCESVSDVVRVLEHLESIQVDIHLIQDFETLYMVMQLYKSRECLRVTTDRVVEIINNTLRNKEE